MNIAQIDRKPVRFSVISEVSLGGGIVLAPGIYGGKSTHTGFRGNQKYLWMPRKHFVELDAEQIEQMGGLVPENGICAQYEVTKGVEAGLITIG